MKTLNVATRREILRLKMFALTLYRGAAITYNDAHKIGSKKSRLTLQEYAQLKELLRFSESHGNEAIKGVVASIREAL